MCLSQPWGTRSLLSQGPWPHAPSRFERARLWGAQGPCEHPLSAGAWKLEGKFRVSSLTQPQACTTPGFREEGVRACVLHALPRVPAGAQLTLVLVISPVGGGCPEANGAPLTRKMP